MPGFIPKLNGVVGMGMRLDYKQLNPQKTEITWYKVICSETIYGSH